MPDICPYNLLKISKTEEKETKRAKEKEKPLKIVHRGYLTEIRESQDGQSGLNWALI